MGRPHRVPACRVGGSPRQRRNRTGTACLTRSQLVLLGDEARWLQLGDETLADGMRVTQQQLSRGCLMFGPTIMHDAGSGSGGDGPSHNRA